MSRVGVGVEKWGVGRVAKGDGRGINRWQAVKRRRLIRVVGKGVAVGRSESVNSFVGFHLTLGFILRISKRYDSRSLMKFCGQG